MTTTSSCERCGAPLADGQCRACDPTTATFIHREIVVLAVLCAAVVIGFVLTREVAKANDELRLRDAAAWYQAGQAELAAGQSEAAVRALRRATAIDRDNRAYALALARALASAGQDDAARQVLLGLRALTPEDAEINAQLARLEARRDDASDTVGYYQKAIYGAWSDDQLETRRAVRIELIRYLLAHHQQGRAVSELIVLSGNLPDDVPSQLEAGQLFLEAGDPARSLERFRRVLRLEPKNQAALAGAGEAAFDSGDYSSAQRYLRAIDAPSARARDLLSVADQVINRDPLRKGLSLGQRQERMVAALTRASETLAACSAAHAGSSDTWQPLRAEADAASAALTLRQLRSTPEALDNALDLVYRIEQQTQAACGDGSAFDRALLLIGRRHDADRK